VGMMKSEKLFASQGGPIILSQASISVSTFSFGLLRFMVELLHTVISSCTFYNMLICFEILDYW
jgi:hypothetical protein